MTNTEIRFAKCSEPGCRERAVASAETHEIHGDGYAVARVTGEYVRCPRDREVFRFVKPVRATLAPAKVCDSKCAMAVSENCKCSCGGSAHGRGALAAHLRH